MRNAVLSHHRFNYEIMNWSDETIKPIFFTHHEVNQTEKSNISNVKNNQYPNCLV